MHLLRAVSKRAGGIGLHDLAGTSPTRLRRAPAAQAAAELLGALPGPAAQRVLASDVTHWRLGDGTEVEIVNFIDDHSRLAVAARVLARATAPAVLKAFQEAGARWGFPAAAHG